MPFPAKLLNEGEEVVVDVRPHWIALAGPVLIAVALVIAAGVGAAFNLPTAVRWVLVALLAIGLANLMLRYLRWRATSLVVTTDRLIHRSGLLAKSGREIPLTHLTDISYRQTVFDRMIGAGDLLLESAGRDSQEVFPALPHPAAIQNDIYRLISARESPRSAPAPGGLSLPEQLERLDDLRRRGVISDAEFESSKAKLLQGR